MALETWRPRLMAWNPFRDLARVEREMEVVRIALENAVSTASLLLLTEATLTEVVGAKDEKAPGL